jgi:hypothetical protein
MHVSSGPSGPESRMITLRGIRRAFASSATCRATISGGHPSRRSRRVICATVSGGGCFTQAPCPWADIGHQLDKAIYPIEIIE